MPPIPFRVVLDHHDAVVQNLQPHVQTIRNPDETFNHMESSDCAWIERMVAEGHIIRLDAITNSGIQRIIVIDGALPSDPIKYKIEVQYGGETANIFLGEDDICSYIKFKNKFMAVFQEILPPMKADAWAEVLRPFIKDAEREVEDTNDSPVVVDIINFIESADVVCSAKELTLGDMHRVWLDESTDTVWVLGNSIKNIIKNYTVLPERVRGLLRTYLRGNSEQFRIGSKRYQLWPFIVQELYLTLPDSESTPDKTSDNTESSVVET